MFHISTQKKTNMINWLNSSSFCLSKTLTRHRLITHCLLLRKPDLRSSTSSMGEEEERRELSEGLKEGELLSPCSTDRELGRSSSDWGKRRTEARREGREVSAKWGKQRKEGVEKRTVTELKKQRLKKYLQYVIMYVLSFQQHGLFI